MTGKRSRAISGNRMGLKPALKFNESMAASFCLMVKPNVSFGDRDVDSQIHIQQLIRGRCNRRGETKGSSFCLEKDSCLVELV
jgi:hypothetical protein